MSAQTKRGYQPNGVNASGAAAPALPASAPPPVAGAVVGDGVPAAACTAASPSGLLTSLAPPLLPVRELNYLSLMPSAHLSVEWNRLKHQMAHAQQQTRQQYHQQGTHWGLGSDATRGEIAISRTRMRSIAACECIEESSQDVGARAHRF
jgi:hypothetical protein